MHKGLEYFKYFTKVVRFNVLKHRKTRR